MKRKFSLNHIQWIIWFVLYTLTVVAQLPYNTLTKAMAYSAVSVGSSALIIYGNAAFLLPRLYERNRKALYVFIALLFLAGITIERSYMGYFLYNYFNPEKPYPFRWSTIYTPSVSTLLIYISSILFYIALKFFKLKQKQEQLQKRHTEAELNLLKAQVQPHFLFNTLNNIYFVAQRESPATATLLEQLSQIMRYFVDEAPKDKIGLYAELNFIKSYIELEKMRMRYPLNVTIKEEGISEGISVPPMLLVPLVENVFKHGIDKLRNDNFISLSLSVEDNRLSVIVENRLAQPSAKRDKSETGLRNLKSRLALLYGDDYILQAGDAGSIFQAKLNIPL